MVALGPFVKAKESVGVFTRRRPSLRALLASRSGRFDRAHAILPSTLAAGESARLTVQAWDEYERLHRDVGVRFRVESTDPESTHPDYVRFDPGHEGVTRVDDVAFRTPGVQYLVLVHESTGGRFVSNPVRVTDGDPERRLFWADLHLHSLRSDGTGSVERGLSFGRDVMALDVVAYTDHDTMGFFIPPSWQRRRMHDRHFDETRTAVEAHNDPGEFVTLFAYEWTKQPNVGGHINVYFDDAESAELFDSMDDETNTYERLWARLREWNEESAGEALTIPHHPAESMYPFDFSATDYDDDLAPLVEVYSQWGSSERPGCAGNRFPLEMGQGEVDEPGHYAQDALRMGYRVGMTASADYHGPHPGHSLIHAKPHLPSLAEWLEDGLGWSSIWRMWNEQSYPGGLHAFYAPELSRESAFEALRSRRVYGTTQPHRIRVDFSVDGVAVGERDSTVRVDALAAEREIRVSVAATAPLRTVEVVKNNEPWRTVESDADAGVAPTEDRDAYVVERSWTDASPVAGMRWDDERGTDDDVYYVRVTQAARRGEYPGMAWAGPIWVGSDD